MRACGGMSSTVMSMHSNRNHKGISRSKQFGFEIVLSTAAGDGAVVDGMNRTVVVTGETTGAFAVVEPFGRSASDIVNRTDFRTLATFDTHIIINHELPVSYHPLVEIAAYYI